MNTALTQIDRLIEVHRFDEARRMLAQLMANHPAEPELGVRAARVEFASGNHDEARHHLESALASDPMHVEARFVLFLLEEDEGNFAQAERIIIELIRENPENGSLMSFYADLLLQTLQLEKARQLVDEALRLDPHSRRAHLTDVTLSMIEGRRDRADHTLADLIADDPDGQEVVGTLLASLIEKGRRREALELAQELLRVQPDNEALVELVVDLAAARHPLMWPMWPMLKFGWLASVVLWLGGVVVMNALRGSGQQTAALVFGSVWLGYIAYTWVAPSLLRRRLARRGI